MRIEITDEYLYKIMPKVAELMLEDVPEIPDMPFKPSLEFEKKMKKLIRKSKRPGWIKVMNRKLSRVACLALCIIAIGVVLSVSVLANESLRMKLKEQIVMEDSVMEYFDVSGEGVIKHLTYIPEGYELIFEDKDFYRAEYQNVDGDQIILDAWKIEDGAVVLRDTEFVYSETKIINGNEAIFGYKEDGVLKVSWYRENVFYQLYIDSLPEEEVVTIIEGMK